MKQLVTHDKIRNHVGIDNLLRVTPTVVDIAQTWSITEGQGIQNLPVFAIADKMITGREKGVWECIWGMDWRILASPSYFR